MAAPAVYSYTSLPGRAINGGHWPGGRLGGGVALGAVAAAGALAVGASALAGGVALADVQPAGAFSDGSLPDWVPAPGGVSVLTRANGRLTNNFIDCGVPYYYQPTVAKIRNDYSTSVCNPHFGTYGATLFFGAGHAASNDNSLIALVLGASTCTFRRMIDPSPVNGSGSDTTTQNLNTLRGGYDWVDPEWADTLVDGKPAAPHSWGCGDVIGPAEGGAAHGTFIRVFIAGGGYGGDIAAQACHKVDFANTTGFADGGTPTYAWQRVARNPGAPTMNMAVSTLGGPNWSAYVASQNRIYYEARAAGATIAPRWLDLTTNTYVQGTGTPRLQDGASTYGETGIEFAVPERNLVVFAYRGPGGVLKIQYQNTTLSNPGWQTPTLSGAPALVEYFATACWCKDNARIVLGELAAGNDTLCEVTIPATLTDHWTCETYTVGTPIAWVTKASYKNWTYNPRVKAIVYPGLMSSIGANAEAVYVHRPRGT